MEKKGIIGWRSPSNIAIVKYWGKKEVQLPVNPSISFTLEKSYTETTISYESGNGRIEFLYDGQPNSFFEQKVKRFIHSLNLKFLSELNIVVDSKNNFPHSAGIASSASAMSALSLCLTDLESFYSSEPSDFLQRSSIRARLGSGSACRSIYPVASLWGKINAISNSSDEYAIGLEHLIHSNFRDLQDWIILVDQKEKSVSSSAGHNLMNIHPYQTNRISQANENIIRLYEILRKGNWEEFIEVAEEEALSLHALMMSSRPGYLLLEPDSIRIIKSLNHFRVNSKIPICYTIDAGPNIHVLFSKKYASNILDWLKSEFPDYVEHSRIIYDNVGTGPIKIM